jgi:hypothetical protein
LSFHGSVCSGNSGLPTGKPQNKNLSEKCGILIPRAACGNDGLRQGHGSARVSAPAGTEGGSGIAGGNSWGSEMNARFFLS